MAEVAKDLNMLKQLLEFVTNSSKAAHRLIGWDRSICWKIEDKKVIGILGMNPSPSCGVEITKGKDSMLGRGGDLCERNESGAFIEELRKILTERGLNTIPVYGFRRLLPGEAGATERLAKLRNQFCF